MKENISIVTQTLLPFFLFSVIALIAGCGSGEEDDTASTSVSSACVAGNTEINISGTPEKVEEAIEVALSDVPEGDPVFVDDGGLDQQLRIAKVTIIGNCNDVSVQDNDSSSDDDNTVDLSGSEDSEA